MPGKINPTIAIALPTWGKVSIAWAMAFKNVGGPLGTNVVQLTPEIGLPIAEARNNLMRSAIASGCDFIFFLGDDVIPPANVIHQLQKRMRENPEIDLVTGMYWTKEYPTQPYIWRGVQRGPYLDWKYGEFFEIDYAGIDCLMIRLTDRMKALGPEWFSVDWQWHEGDDPTLMLLPTEDFYFFTKTRKAGMKLWCDSNVQCIHEDRNSGEQFALRTEMPQYTDAVIELPEAGTDAAPLVKIADVGCGFGGPFFGHADQVKIVRFDANEKVHPDFRCDIRHLPVPDQSFDVVHARHVLEHFGRDETRKVLWEWIRILRVGGEFRLSVPNLMHAIERVILMEAGAIGVDHYPWWQLYGKQDDEYDVHKNGFTVKRLQMLFEKMGCFEDIEVATGSTAPGTPDSKENLFVKARKVKHLDKKFALIPEWEAIAEAEGIELDGVVPERCGWTVGEGGEQCVRDKGHDGDHKTVLVEAEPVKSTVGGSASWLERLDREHDETVQAAHERDPVGYAARNGGHE